MENLDGIALAAGASSYITNIVYELDASSFTDPTQVPEALTPCFLELLGQAKWRNNWTSGEVNNPRLKPWACYGRPTI